MHNECREILTCPPHVDAQAAETLLKQLRPLVAGGVPVAVDASQVEQLSYPAMQVMLSWARTDARALVCVPSAAFESAWAQVGLADALPVSNTRPPPLPRPEPASAAAEPVEAAAVDPSSPAPIDAPRLKRILTIDDSKTMRDMLRLTLTRSGFEVLQAVDGCDGLDVLAREEIDVIITDINMPRMDGYGVIQNVRSDSKYDATPILVLTTESDREKKDRARDLGATGFIVKPFDPAKLVDVIARVSP
jgi:two-component system chemotaxis response regulator CheY